MYITQVKLHSECYPTDRYYPFNIPTLRRTVALALKKPVAFFVGENGSGKSTLLEALTRKCGVHIWDKVKRPRRLDNPSPTAGGFLDVRGPTGIPRLALRAETFQEMVDFLDDAALCDTDGWPTGGICSTPSRHWRGISIYFQGRYHMKGCIFWMNRRRRSRREQLKFLKMLQFWPESDRRSSSRTPFADSAGIPGRANFQLR